MLLSRKTTIHDGHVTRTREHLMQIICSLSLKITTFLIAYSGKFALWRWRQTLRKCASVILWNQVRHLEKKFQPYKTSVMVKLITFPLRPVYRHSKNLSVDRSPGGSDSRSGHSTPLLHWLRLAGWVLCIRFEYIGAVHRVRGKVICEFISRRAETVSYNARGNKFIICIVWTGRQRWSEETGVRQWQTLQ